ncbi:MAG: transglycosylase SLT domain-containing protein [Burkholderiales bacterium]|nr:transglycosylase SLT domain-containing protein [Burkholderiales bacterium]
MNQSSFLNYCGNLGVKREGRDVMRNSHVLPHISMMFLSCASSLALASPFVTLSPDPELAALRPVTSIEAPQAAKISEPPVLVLNFLPDEKDRKAKLHFADVWDRIRAGFALPAVDTKEVAQSEAWYAARPEVVKIILERSRYYLFHIVEEIEKRDMPMELALLPFVESGFDPFALSSAQASGLWQFIPGTGARYKLQQNEGFDARRDIIASTTAALDYLQDLHAQFGDWRLALAAYNWGENQIARAVERNRLKGLPADFTRLQLPAETRNYVPRLIAVKQIVMSPQSFRVALPAVPNLRYFTTVARPASVDLTHAARLAEMKIEDFKALNPAYNYSIIKASATMPLLVPVDRAPRYERRLEEFMQQEQARQKHRPVTRSRRTSK